MCAAALTWLTGCMSTPVRKAGLRAEPGADAPLLARSTMAAPQATSHAPPTMPENQYRPATPPTVRTAWRVPLPGAAVLGAEGLARLAAACARHSLRPRPPTSPKALKHPRLTGKGRDQSSCCHCQRRRRARAWELSKKDNTSRHLRGAAVNTTRRVPNVWCTCTARAPRQLQLELQLEQDRDCRFENQNCLPCHASCGVGQLQFQLHLGFCCFSSAFGLFMRGSG
jgi:hypothetical protein